MLYSKRKDCPGSKLLIVSEGHSSGVGGKRINVVCRQTWPISANPSTPLSTPELGRICIYVWIHAPILTVECSFIFLPSWGYVLAKGGGDRHTFGPNTLPYPYHGYNTNPIAIITALVKPRRTLPHHPVGILIISHIRPIPLWVNYTNSLIYGLMHIELFKH